MHKGMQKGNDPMEQVKENSLVIYVGNQPEPENMLKLRVLASDYAMLPRGTRATAIVTDLDTGKRYQLRRASCGLPRCLCALALVKEL